MPDPPEAYYRYKELAFWKMQHLPLAGGLDDQPWLLMRQIAAVGRAVVRYNDEREAAERAAQKQ